MTRADSGAVSATSVQITYGRNLELAGGTPVTRLLPSRRRRTVGPWCFADLYRLPSGADRPAMEVAPHPHVGLETVTYLVAGEVVHRDGLGNEALVRPGEVSLMTAGTGLAHSERSRPGGGPLLHGVQLWIALPGHLRHVAPEYHHLTEIPTVDLGDFDGRVLLGAFAGTPSMARGRSPTVAVELVSRPVPGIATATVALDPAFEYGVVALDGMVTCDTTPVATGTLAVLGAGAERVVLRADGRARTLLLGGAPLGEDLLMWWNFVARTADEISEARARWEAGGFAPVIGDTQEPIPAPPLPPGRLRPRP
ncbi:MAG TPA: pirin family protein [Acidimicrobiales bacterium]|nr:pirin family protein [Acidimicrobiales bacterium]